MQFMGVEDHQRCLEEEWSKGSTDIEAYKRHIDFFRYRIHKDVDLARRILPVLKEIADSGLPLPTAHIIVGDCYKRGHGINADPHFALRYLEAAVRLDSDDARWRYGLALVNNEGYEGALDENPDKALEIFRELCSRNYGLAYEPAVKLLIKGKHAGQLAPKDEEFVRQYADWKPSFLLYYELARFFSAGLKSSDYAGPEYRRARDLLIRGLNDDRNLSMQRQCEALLDEWGVKPVPVAPLPPPTTAQKVAYGAKVTGYLGVSVAVMIAWAFIGSALLALANAITAVTLPVLAVVMSFSFVVSKYKGKDTDKH